MNLTKASIHCLCSHFIKLFAFVVLGLVSSVLNQEVG